jgi:hypothetical protein
MLDFLAGKKTYIAVIAGIAAVVADLAGGGVDVNGAIVQILTLLGVGGLRAGVSKVGK